ASLSAPGLERSLRIQGELGVGRMTIARADAWTARHDWARVERYLADPLASLGTRVFPPPELVVRATSEEEAVRLAAIGDDPPQARCEAVGVEIRCAPRSDSDVRGSLRRIARAALETSAGGSSPSE
nr:hypothetical protein [Myxococcota bacterium]